MARVWLGLGGFRWV